LGFGFWGLGPKVREFGDSGLKIWSSRFGVRSLGFGV
jgi:hypothetical protein